jgi:hypothetical protein
MGLQAVFTHVSRKPQGSPNWIVSAAPRPLKKNILGFFAYSHHRTSHVNIDLQSIHIHHNGKFQTNLASEYHHGHSKGRYVRDTSSVIVIPPSWEKTDDPHETVRVGGIVPRLPTFRTPRSIHSH